MKSVYELLAEYKEKFGDYSKIVKDTELSLDIINSIINNEIVNRAYIDILRIYLLDVLYN